MFFHSGFKRTLCGGQWEALSTHSHLPSTGRVGCCPPDTFMASPNLNPFSKATACEACPVGQYGSTMDDDMTSCTNCGTGNYHDQNGQHSEACQHRGTGTANTYNHNPMAPDARFPLVVQNTIIDGVRYALVFPDPTNEGDATGTGYGET